MRISEGERIVQRMKFLLGLIGEPHERIDFIFLPAFQDERRYAQFSAGMLLGNPNGEQVVLYVNPNKRLAEGDDLSVEEIAIHEVRHIVQHRRGSKNYASYVALWRRMVSIGDPSGRLLSLFVACCDAARGDLLEADAMFVAALAYDLDYPVHDALVL